MYGSEIYRIFPSCADPALLPAFVYTIILIGGVAKFADRTGKMYNTENSRLRKQRIRSIIIWDYTNE